MKYIALSTILSVCLVASAASQVPTATPVAVGSWKTRIPVNCPNGKSYPPGTDIPGPNDAMAYLCGSDSSSSSMATSLLGALPMATNMRQAIAIGAAQAVLSGVISSLFSDNSQADQQRRELEQELERQREEAARQRALAEQKRIDEMFARLGKQLKLDGLPELALKGIGPNSELKLKGLNADESGGLKLKLSTDNQTKQTSDCAGKSWGIPGLPGVYLNNCHQPTLFFPNAPGASGPVQAAQVAQNLSGSTREVVEQAVLNAAKNDSTLMSASTDPKLANFQQADHAYEQAVQEQSAASQQYTAAQAKVEDDQSVMKVVSSKLDQATASPAQQAALAQMAAAAKTDEQAAALARQGFDTAAAKVPVAREQAVQMLAAVRLPGSAMVSVDLSNSKQPLVPQNVASPQAGSMAAPGVVPPSNPKISTPAQTELSQSTGASKACVGSDGRSPLTFSLQNATRSDVEQRLSKLNEELQGIQELLRRLSKTEAMNQAERTAWTKEMEEASLRALQHGGEMLLSGSLEQLNGRFEDQELRNERAIAYDRDMLQKPITDEEKALQRSYISSREQQNADLARMRKGVEAARTTWEGVHAMSVVTDDDTSKLEKSLEVLHTALGSILNNSEAQRILNYDKVYAGWFSYSKDFVDSMYDALDVGFSWYRQSAENRQTDVYSERVKALNERLRGLVGCIGETKDWLRNMPSTSAATH